MTLQLLSSTIITVEQNVIIWLQQFGGDFLIGLNRFLSAFGEELIMVAILGLVYWGLDKKMGEFIGFNLLTTNVLNPMIKNIAKRYRPYMQNNSVKCLKPVDANADLTDIVSQGYSFPSGHSSGSAALYTSFPIYKDYGKKYRILIALGVVIPFLVGFSRVFLGVHYPTDVFGGWALGLAVVILMSTLLELVPNKYLIYLITAGVCLLGSIYCRTNDYFTSMGMLLGFIGGVYFEEKFVKFENTKVWWRIILRVALGCGLFLGLNMLIKLPVDLYFGSGDWSDDITAGQFIFRTVRYAVIVFLMIGVYPLLFKPFTKLFLKWGWISDSQTKPSYLRNK